MNKQNLNLLILEDNPDHAELMVKELKKEGFIFEWERVETKKSFKKALAKKPDIILSDYNLPSFDGMTAIRLQQQTAPDIPLILVSGTIGEDLAVECMKAGAIDYVLKDKLSRLGHVIKRAIKEAEEHIKRKQAEEEIVKLSKIAETTPEAIIITDIQGKIEYVNPGLLAMGGFEDDSKIIGQSLFLFSDEDGKKRLHEEVIPGLLSGGKWKGEIPVKRKDGSVFPAEMICSIILDEKGQPKYLLSNYNDITERKHAEKELQKRLRELEVYYKATLGREGRIIELKHEINRLLEQFGEKRKYGV